MELFKLEQISFQYPGRSVAAIRALDLSIREHEFVLLLGHSGSGKTTVARILSGLIPDYYGGTLRGNVLFRGKPFSFYKAGEARREIGLVFQNPERQLIAFGVDKELAFGLENLGVSGAEMERRIQAVRELLHLDSLAGRSTRLLSGGEKQRVVLGAILAMGPRVLILDEPTAQLDPEAAAAFFDHLKMLHRKMGYTILLIEQRAEQALVLTERVLFFQDGMLTKDEPISRFVQSASELEAAYVRGRKKESASSANLPQVMTQTIVSHSAESVVSVRDLSFAYPGQPPLFHRFSLEVPKGKVTAVLGKNGAGKSTLLKLIAGFIRPGSGEILVGGRRIEGLDGQFRNRMIGYLSQQPDDYLFHETVLEEIQYSFQNLGNGDPCFLDQALDRFGLTPYRKAHPRDLSVGERIRVVLASVMVAQPKLLLLDEPTRGLDPYAKANLASTLKQITEDEGRSVILVSQDIDFARDLSDETVTLSGG